MSYLARARNAAILLALAAAAPLSAQTAPLKIAYVNTRNILDAAPGRPDAEAQLQKEATVMQEKAKKMSDSLQAAIDAARGGLYMAPNAIDEGFEPYDDAEIVLR